MGQSNGSTLGNQEEISKVFRIESRAKEQNLIFLDHLTTHKPYLLREMNFKEESELLERLSQLKGRQDIKNPHLTNLIKLEHDKHDDLCSKYFKIHSLWEFPRRTLAEDINDRALARQPYQSQEINNLIRQIAEGCLALQQYRITHESLTSRTILVQNALTYRVADPLAVPNHPNLDMIYHKRSLKNIYLSPQQCRIIDQQDIKQPVFDPYREDVFTAGMIVLQAGLLHRQDQCYEDDCARINWKQVQFNLSRFEESYGPKLRKYLDIMLVPDTSQRADWLKLIKIVGEVTPKDRTEFIHRVSAGPPPSLPPRVVTEHRPMRSSLMFSYHNPNPQNTILVSRPVTNTQPCPIRPVSNISHLSQPPQYSVIVRQPQKDFVFSNIKTSKASPVRFLNNESNTSPSRKSPQEFKEEKEELVYTVDEFKNGGKYEGYKANGKREGFGKYTYQEGGRYEGQWKNDLMCGKGKLYYQSGKIAYDGYLENDLFHGSGTLYNETPEKLTTPFNYQNFEDVDEYWVSYDGQFRQDKKEGHGILLLTNGEVLQGSFHEDKVEGEGCFITLKEEKIKGVWHENKFERRLP